MLLMRPATIAYMAIPFILPDSKDGMDDIIQMNLKETTWGNEVTTFATAQMIGKDIVTCLSMLKTALC